jgi:hypothetical protein
LKSIKILIAILTSLIVIQLKAQENSDEELSLDDPAPAVPQQTQSEMTSESQSSGERLKPTMEGAKSKKKYPIKVKQIETIYLFDGWSFGAVGLGTNYNVSSEFVVNGVAQDLSSKSSQLYAIGGIARYGRAALDEVGSTIDFTGAFTVSHGNLGSRVYLLKIDFNLLYAFEWRNLNGYPFIGAGYEHVAGDNIQNILAAGGNEYHIGGGVEWIKNYFFELMVQFTQHSLSSRFINDYQNDAYSNGATSAYFNTGSSKVSSTIIMGRIIYSF